MTRKKNEHQQSKVDPPIVGHYHILDIKNEKFLLVKVCMENFTKNSCMTIHYWPYMCKKLHSICCDYDGANNDAILTFNNNSGKRRGGAIHLENSTFYVDTNFVHFSDNKAVSGGAMYLGYGTMHINSNKSVMFSTNTSYLPLTTSSCFHSCCTVFML